MTPTRAYDANKGISTVVGVVVVVVVLVVVVVVVVVLVVEYLS